jgi:hypothetical protein
MKKLLIIPLMLIAVSCFGGWIFVRDDEPTLENREYKWTLTELRIIINAEIDKREKQNKDRRYIEPPRETLLENIPTGNEHNALGENKK